MGITVPGYLDQALDVIGVDWPNLDEDEFKELADAYREFADEIDGARADGKNGAAWILDGTTGIAAEAFEKHFGKLNNEHLHDLAEGARLLATSLDAAALVIEGAKGRAIVQLIILADAIIAAAAASTVTFGLAAIAGLAEVAIVRTAVKRIFKELEEALMEKVVEIATAPAVAALEGTANELIAQLVENATGARDGYDVHAALNAGGQGAQDAMPTPASVAQSFDPAA
ncbi:hypothetical protein [Streptomyces sp. SID3343]|uniref:WXG100-like domain-containing protein n=1 Tax=Streptomyces sp. SID3343 TaxID=2690260 RepID=UPI00136AF467|nr:hypothetical protein [Streptomyces sp. SID3343]MYW04394.1 hypothetical protein [Streptomyces sp. SID3343]